MATPRTPSIFEGERVKSGIYKIQNLRSETFLDIHLHSMELCCRPAGDLAKGRGLWEIKRFWDGYLVSRVDAGNAGNPVRFCNPMQGLEWETPVFVTGYPVAWKIERFEGTVHQGLDCVRFRWGPAGRSWDLWNGKKENGAPVKLDNFCQDATQAWILTPVEAEETVALQLTPETLGLGPLPPYDRDVPPAQARHEYERDGFGTVVTEISIVTTRKRYRVEGA